MNHLEKYSDEELFNILDSDVKEEIKSRGYEFGWHKKTTYAGVIYILVNPAFSNLVKIGYTDNIESRLKSLNRNSGLPDPYHVYATYKVKKRLEDLKLHALIDSLDSGLRHAKNKEFYEMTPEKAYDILSAIAQINGNEDLLELNPAQDSFFDVSNTNKREENVLPEVQEKNNSRRAPLTFGLLSIPVGSKLVYKDNQDIVVTTADDKSNVIYNGKNYTLSGVVKFLKKGGSWQGGDYFLYNGKKLTALRMEMENR